MEPSMHTNSTSACDTSTCEAIDTKSVLVGFMIGMVLCSPCVWLTGRRLLRNIKTKLSQRYNITTPDEDDSFRLLSNQNHHIPAKNQGRHSGCTSDNKNETDSLLEFGIDQDHFHLNTESFSKLKRDEESGIVDLGRSESNSITDIFKTTHVLEGRHSGCTSDNKNETDSLLEFGIDQDYFHLNTESFSKLKRDEESGIVDLGRSESNSITDIFKTTHVLEGRHSGCTVHMKNETDSLLAFAIGKDKFNLDTKSHSKLKGDEESGIVDSGRSKSITDIFETTNFLGDKIDLKVRLWMNLSKYDILDCMPVETELKLTSPANSNDKDQTNLHQSTNTEQALALVDENVGTSNDEDQTNLNRSTNTEQALAIVNKNIDTNNDRERSKINWDVVFQKCVDLVKPLEYYQFFITLFGTIGIDNPGRIIEDARANNPLNQRTLILKLFQHWREYTGSGDIKAYIESTFEELRWNTFLEEFKKIMRNPPLVRANSFHPIAQHLPTFPQCTSSLSEDGYLFSTSHYLANQQDAKVDTRVEQIITCNGVTRKTVRQETSEILHNEDQCVSGKHVKSEKRKRNMSCGKNIINKQKCLKNIDTVKQIDASQNDHPRQNAEVNGNSENTKTVSQRKTVTKLKDRRRKLKRGRYTLLSYNGSRYQPLKHMPSSTSSSLKVNSGFSSYPSTTDYRRGRNSLDENHTKTDTKFTNSNTSLNREQLNNNKFDRKDRLSSSYPYPRGHTLLSYHGSRYPSLNQMSSSNSSASNVDSGFSGYPQNINVVRGTDLWNVHTDLSSCDPYPRGDTLLSYRGSRYPSLNQTSSSNSSSLKFYSGFSSYPSDTDFSRGRNSLDENKTKTNNKPTHSNTSFNTEKLNNNKFKRKKRLSSSNPYPRGHTLLSYHGSRYQSLNQMYSSNSSASNVDSGFSSYPRNINVVRGTDLWNVHTDLTMLRLETLKSIPHQQRECLSSSMPSRRDYEDNIEDSSNAETVRQECTGLFCGEDTTSSSHIIKLIEKVLAHKLPIDKADYEVYLNNIIARITNRFQTKEQILELKLDELKDKEKGYYLLSRNKLLLFSEKDWNSLILYVENARSKISDSFQTDMVFITYDGTPLKDVI